MNNYSSELHIMSIKKEINANAELLLVANNVAENDRLLAKTVTAYNFAIEYFMLAVKNNLHGWSDNVKINRIYKDITFLSAKISETVGVPSSISGEVRI